MFPSIVQRFGQQATLLTAATIDMLVLFDTLKWSGEQVGGVNLVAALIWGVIFGDGVRELNKASDA